MLKAITATVAATTGKIARMPPRLVSPLMGRPSLMRGALLGRLRFCLRPGLAGVLDAPQLHLGAREYLFLAHFENLVFWVSVFGVGNGRVGHAD